jgi:hypothetical protein
MAVKYDREGGSGVAVLSCDGCGRVDALGIELVDDIRMDAFIRDHHDCVVTPQDAPIRKDSVGP